MSSDKMTEAWKEKLFWDDDSEKLWDVFVERFARQSEDARIVDLNVIREWAEEENQPTRAAASLLTKQREAEAIHRRLKAAGR